MLKKYEGEVRPTVSGPPGREVELFQVEDQAAAVAGLVERLCEEGEVPPQDVAVLSAHGFEKSAISRTKAGRFSFVKDPRPVGPYVHLSSIRGFKGLEAPAVILCELEDLDPQTKDQQLYVGLSRARNYCAIVAPKRRG